jgi:EmrB/QacA subfamily drug resistance transporter
MTDARTAERRKWLALVLLAMAQFMVVVDASITNVALPSIGEDLRISQDDLSWVVNAYVLTFGGFLLLGGRMADLLGRRRMFMSGLLLFALASLLGGLSESEAQLIPARALQGLGGALMSPAALSIVTTTFAEGVERNRALGVWGAVVGAGGAAGVLFGGILTDGLGWEWVLFVNVPIGLAAAALAPALIRESRVDSGTRAFDVAGAVAVTAGLAALVYGLVDANDAGWGSAQTLGLLAAASTLIAAFVVIELRSAHPLVPFRIFRNRTLTGANVTGLLIGAGLFSMFFFLSLYMQQVLGYDALEAGLAYLPLAVSIVVASGVASPLVTRVGPKPVLLVGLVLMSAALVWLSGVSVGGSFLADILGPSMLAGIGLGLSYVPLTVAAVSGIRADDAGLASGLINTAQQIGGAIGLAVLATVANAQRDGVLEAARGAREQVPLAMTEGFGAAFLAGAGIALVGLVATALLIRSRDDRAQIGGEPQPVPAG